jgi:colanic acid biosynthesis glycosyl transferase WcaI
MKIGFLSQYFPPETGAPQNRIHHLCTRARMRQHEVVVLTAFPNYPTGRIFDGYRGMLKTEKNGGMSICRTYIYPTTSMSPLRRMLSYLSFVVSSMVVGPWVMRGVDVIIVESPPLFLGISAFWISRMCGSKLIFNVSDLWPRSAAELGIITEESWQYSWSRQLEEWIYRKSWLVCGQSEGIVNDIQKRMPAVPVYRYSNGVALDTFDATAHLHSQTNDRKQFVVRYVGLHGIAQGLEQVLRCAEEFVENENVVFQFIGEGSEKDYLKQVAEEKRLVNVKFLDPVPVEKVPALLCSADVIVVSLKTELRGAVPSKMYEAFAARKPVLAILSGEPADLVRKYEAGIAVSPGDLCGLVSALQQLIDGKELCSRLGANGRHAAEKYFDRDRIAEEFLDFLERLTIEDRVENKRKYQKKFELLPGRDRFSKISIAMPVRNEGLHIDRCLSSVQAQVLRDQVLEIIVADGRSDDDTRRIVQEHQAKDGRIQLIDNPKRIVPTGLNAAIRRSHGDIIIRIDGHCEVPANFVQSLLDTLSTVEADCVGGVIETIGETPKASAIAAALSSPFGVGNAHFRTGSNESRYVDTVAFGAYRRSVFEKFGLFDEELVRDQDDEFSLRLQQSGAKIWLNPAIRSRYYSRSSLMNLWQQYQEYGKFKIRVIQKRKKIPPIRSFAPGTLVLTLSAAVAIGLVGFNWTPLLLLTTGYLSGLILAALFTKKVLLRHRIGLAYIFAILHLSYGFGFIWGLIRFAPRWGDKGKVPRLQTAEYRA